MRVRSDSRPLTLVVGSALLLAALSLGARPETDLERKAVAFRAALVDRHLSPEGVVLYRMDLRTLRDDLRRGTYPVVSDAPTFTGLFAAASCSRANAEDDPREALEDASAALAGLELLTDVTGRRGLLARSVRRDEGADFTGLRGKWFRGADPYTNYAWRGDASADQYANGLLPALAACAPHFPERTRRLAAAFAERLLADDMQLLDPDGERTRFGDLSFRSGLGFNSIFQLTGYAAFALAAELDPDPRWSAQRDRLRDRYRVPARSRTTNLRVGALTNHSNDLMAWNLCRVLVPLARRTNDPALADLRHAMHRAWLRVREDGNPYFAAVLCHVEPESCDEQALASGHELLARFPLEKRRLAPSPELEALPRRWLPGRKWKTLAVDPVPIELRPVSSLEWKSSPYRLEGGASPDFEFTGVDYLLAYWLYREIQSSPRSR